MNFKISIPDYYGKLNIPILLISIISSIVLIGMIGIIPFQPSQNTYAIGQGKCPNMKFLEAHTYGAWSLSTQDGSRLKILHECVVLEGVVRANPTVSDEKDGDLKFGVNPTKDMKILWIPNIIKKEWS